MQSADLVLICENFVHFSPCTFISAVHRAQFGSWLLHRFRHAFGVDVPIARLGSNLPEF